MPEIQTLSPSPAVNPHYGQIGGEASLRQLVERFYQLMEEIPVAAELRAMHPSDLEQSKERLFMFLSGWMGGPPLYAQTIGPPRLRQAHLSFSIDSKARDAWMTCMKQALSEQIEDPDLLAEITASFFRTADFLRNQSE
mgnify:CR=1 FL=1